MFFGRSEDKPEDLEFPEAAGVLKSSFNRKLGSLDAKAARMMRSIDEAVVSLGAAAEEFRELDKEPDTDFIRATSTNYIKEQKNSYALLLARILSSHARQEKEHETIYDKYYEEIQRIGALLSDVLKANAQFKMVLDAYPNDLNRFKRAFSAIEMQWRVLKAELEMRNRETSEYREILEQLESVAALEDELGLLHRSMEELSHQSWRRVEAVEIERIEERIRLLREQGRLSAKKIAGLKADVSMILGALDKPARKHDYMALHKPKLMPLLENPDALRDASKYAELRSQVAEIKDEIEKGSITVKNAEEVGRAIDAALGPRLRGLLDEIYALESAMLPANSEIRELERESQELRDAVSGASKRVSAISRITERISEIGAEKARLSGNVERLFYSYYRKRIRLKMP